MKDFEGKTAVVTGAASGIGYGLAEKLAQEKMQVVLADVEEEALNKAVNQLQQYQHRVIGVKTDVLIKESVSELFARANEEYGNIHILCNNAGIGASSGNKGIWEVDKENWDWTLGVNFYGVLYGLQAFLPHMVAHGEEGHVVTTETRHDSIFVNLCVCHNPARRYAGHFITAAGGKIENGKVNF